MLLIVESGNQECMIKSQVYHLLMLIGAAKHLQTKELDVQEEQDQAIATGMS